MTHLPRKLPFLVLQPRKYQNEEVCININIKKSHDHDSIMKRENIKSHYNKGFFFYIFLVFVFFFLFGGPGLPLVFERSPNSLNFLLTELVKKKVQV